MRRAKVLTLAVGLLACSEAEQADQLVAADDTALMEPTMPEVALSEADLVRVCKAGQHHSTGTPLGTMSASASADDTVRISYIRSDGKAFRYDCRVSGDIIQTRMIDEAGPGKGAGSWSGRGSTVTYEIDPEGITLETVFFDGSTDSERVEI